MTAGPRPGAFRSVLAATPPRAGVEIAADRVTAVALGTGPQPMIAAYAIEALPPGAVVPSVTGANVVDAAALDAALARALAAIGKPRRIAVAVPDAAAKVSLVRFDKVPSKSDELEKMIRWQVRKTVPFPIDRAQIGWTEGQAVEGGGREFVVVAMRRETVEEYEQACRRAGAQPGIVDLASLNAVNAVIAGQNGATDDWLLVHITADSSTLAIVRGSALIFYRNRSAETDDLLTDLVHQTAMYYEDRLQGRGFARVVVAATSEAEAELNALRGALAGRVSCPIETIDVTRAAALTDRISAPPLVHAALAPATGLVLRER